MKKVKVAVSGSAQWTVKNLYFTIRKISTMMDDWEPKQTHSGLLTMLSVLTSLTRCFLPCVLSANEMYYLITSIHITSASVPNENIHKCPALILSENSVICHIPWNVTVCLLPVCRPLWIQLSCYAGLFCRTYTLSWPAPSMNVPDVLNHKWQWPRRFVCL